jgi:phosphoribosylaminoimidazole (AIR) synthetase
MGIGMVAILAPQDVASFQADLGEESWIIGQLVSGSKEIHLME